MTADSEQRYRRTLDNLLEGFQIIGRDWTYLYVNPAAARQGRSTPALLEGRKMYEAYPGIDQAPLFAALARCMDERTPVAFENPFTYPDGTTRWFELRVEPVPEGICVHSVDVDDRKAAQAALQRLNDDLEGQVRARTRELELLNAELEAFSYSVSHDLRAPLRHVAGFAEMLRKHPGAVLDDKGRAYLGHIVDAAGRMGRLIDDLLAFSRMGRAAMDKRAVSLAALVREARRELAAEEEAREVAWSLSGSDEVYGDPALLRQVLINLLSNALKYTRERRPARIELSAERHPSSGEVTVCVKDNGVGFDMRYADRLFGVFQRLHDAKLFEGTGIGLANVRQIVRRHGGRTWAHAVPDEGAAFYFSLPGATGLAEDAPPPS